jgi:hypothetical protein
LRSLVLNGAAALILFANTALVSAQSTIKPGQIATAPGVSLSLRDAEAAASSTSATQKTSIAEISDRHDRVINRMWICSMFAAIAATGADAATSWGKTEGNGLLASQDGTFGAKGLSMKAGLAAGIIMPQILFRKHKDLKSAFALGNLADAAIFTGVSIHNVGIASTSR